MSHITLPNFDTLQSLAKHEPDKLEQLLKEAVQELISSANEQDKRRLLGLQFQIDAQRQMAKNPMDSCIKISSMMHESLIRLRQSF